MKNMLKMMLVLGTLGVAGNANAVTAASCIQTYANANNLSAVNAVNNATNAAKAYSYFYQNSIMCRYQTRSNATLCKNNNKPDCLTAILAKYPHSNSVQAAQAAYEEAEAADQLTPAEQLERDEETSSQTCLGSGMGCDSDAASLCCSQSCNIHPISGEGTCN